MDYTDSGFDNLLNKNSISQDTSVKPEDEASYGTPALSGTSITSGISRSSTGKLTVNWDKEYIAISNGARDRIQLGNIQGTGSYGARILDEKGNTILEVSDKLQQFTAYDGSFNRVIQIDSNGFHGYLISGTETIRINEDGVQGFGTTGNTFKFYDVAGGTLYGQMGYLASENAFYYFAQNGAKSYVLSDETIVASEGNSKALHLWSTGTSGSIDALADQFTFNTLGIDVLGHQGVTDTVDVVDVLGSPRTLTFIQGLLVTP